MSQKPVEQPTTAADASAAVLPASALPTLHVSRTWPQVFQGQARKSLESSLPRLLVARRWFGGKAKPIRTAMIADVVPMQLGEGDEEVALTLIHVDYVNEEPETYVMPLAFAAGDRAAQWIADQSPALVAHVRVRPEGKAEHGTAEEGVLYDAFGDEQFSQILLDTIASRRRFAGTEGKLQGQPTRSFRGLRGPVEEHLTSRALKVEQSNSSVVYGDRLLLKLFRRIEEGVNPDLEIGLFLTDVARFPHMAPLAGGIEYRNRAGATSTLAILQGFVRNEGDAWTYTLDAVYRFFEQVRAKYRTIPAEGWELPKIGLVCLAEQKLPPLAVDMCDAYLESAALLGQRTAEFHLALATATDNPDFAPEPFSELYQQSLYQAMRDAAQRTFRLLRGKLKQFPDEVCEELQTVLVVEQEILDGFRRIVGRKIGGARIRCHGDYHLGQVLFTGKDFVIIDFEGEPSRKISERRIKRSPLRDVAGMIRSFDYASQSILLNQLSGIVHKDELPTFQRWAQFWSLWTSVRFLQTYLETVGDSTFIPQSRDEVQLLLDVFLLEKAVYELDYELNNRPSWVRVPVQGILRTLEWNPP